MDNLRLLRQRAGLTQQQLAEKLGGSVSQEQIHSYEAGGYLPKLSTLIRMADFFDTSIDCIVGRIQPGSGFDVAESGLSEPEKELVDRYRRYNVNQRKTLALYMDVLEGK